MTYLPVAEMYSWTPTREDTRLVLWYLRGFTLAAVANEEIERAKETAERVLGTSLTKALVQWVSALQREDGGSVGHAFVQSLAEWHTHVGPFVTEETEPELREWVTRSVIRYLHATREGTLETILSKLSEENGDTRVR